MIALSGATGFIGSALTEALVSHGAELRALVRDRSVLQKVPQVDYVEFDGLDTESDFGRKLSGVKTFVHLAGRAHVLKERSEDPWEAFQRINVIGTRNLASQAASAGVERFIFVSSVKVNGEGGQNSLAYTFKDAPAPQDNYGKSKQEAEKELREISLRTGMEVVIVRPPLVYGRNAKGNVGLLVKAIKLGVPLPLGGIENSRSMVGLGNLVSLIEAIIYFEKPLSGVFLASDGEDLSTSEFINELGMAMNKPARMFSIPNALGQKALAIAGKTSIVNKLYGNLQVDITHTRNALGWTPPNSVREELYQMFNC